MATWAEFDNLNPRVSMSLGATIPLPGYANVKPTVGLEVDVPEGSTVEEVFDNLEAALMEKLQEVADVLEDEIEHR